MRKLWGSIFGSSKNTETVVNGAVNGIDKLFFTAEEKSEASAKAGEWFLKYLEATQPQNLARRLIAIMIVALWSLLIVAGVALYKFDAAYSQFIFDILADVVMNPFLMVMGFYFAAHVLRSWQGKKE